MGFSKSGEIRFQVCKQALSELPCAFISLDVFDADKTHQFTQICQKNKVVITGLNLSNLYEWDLSLQLRALSNHSMLRVSLTALAPILVWGRIQVRNYEKDNAKHVFTEVIADNFQVLDRLPYEQEEKNKK